MIHAGNALDDGAAGERRFRAGLLGGAGQRGKGEDGERKGESGPDGQQGCGPLEEDRLCRPYFESWASGKSINDVIRGGTNSICRRFNLQTRKIRSPAEPDGWQ